MEKINPIKMGAGVDNGAGSAGTIMTAYVEEYFTCITGMLNISISGFFSRCFAHFKMITGNDLRSFDLLFGVATSSCSISSSVIGVKEKKLS